MQQENYYDVDEGPPVMMTTPGRVARTGPAATPAGTHSGPQEHHASLLIPRGLRRLLTGT